MLLCVGAATAAVMAWRARRARLWVALLVAQVLVIVVAPSFYAHYSAYSTAALCLVLAAAVSLVPTARRTVVAAATGAVLVLTAAAAPVHRAPTFPAAEVRRLLPPAGCIQSDSPGVLALLDVLTRDERRHCTVPVDLSGQTYDVGSHDPAGHPVPRSRNRHWQLAATAYLSSGSAAVMVRGVGDSFDVPTVRALEARHRMVRLPGVRVLLPRTPEAVG